MKNEIRNNLKRRSQAKRISPKNCPSKIFSVNNPEKFSKSWPWPINIKILNVWTHGRQIWIFNQLFFVYSTPNDFTTSLSPSLNRSWFCSRYISWSFRSIIQIMTFCRIYNYLQENAINLNNRSKNPPDMTWTKSVTLTRRWRR